MEKVATIETFTMPVLPQVSPLAIGVFRLFVAIVVFSTAIIRVNGEGFTGNFNYRPGSKLIATPARMKGWRILSTYTWWSFLLLGASFGSSAIISLAVVFESESRIHPWLLRFALLSFEISAPNAFMVSAMVKYALWPVALRTKGPEGTLVYRSTSGLLAHNFNSISVLSEVCLLGGLPVHMEHMALAPMFGMTFVLYAWGMANFWVPEKGPQFFYYFLDTTLGWTTTISLAVLLSVLLVFYMLFSKVDDFLEHMGGGVITHVLSVVICSVFLCRFRN